MSEFVYKAITASGQTVEGAMEGKDEKSVVQSLQQMGYIPLRIATQEAKGVGFSFSSFFPQRVGVKNLLIFTQELSTLVGSGLPIDRSLNILASMTENVKLQEIVRDVLKKIQEGSSLGDALESYPKIFSKLYVNMVKAGESGGFLEVILVRLAKYLESSKEIRDSVVSAMIYPAILVVASSAIVAFLVTFLIPRFTNMFSDMGQALPLPTQIVMLASKGVTSYWYFVIGTGVFLYFGLKAYQQNEERKLRWDTMKLKMVLLGDLLMKVEIARFARTLGTLLQSGVPILTALNLVKGISQNLAISRSIAVLHDRLREGKGIAKSLEENKIFPMLAIHMIGVGEETGKLDEMLNRVAQTYEENVQTAVKRVVSILEPLIILVMGVVVGFIFIAMLFPIISMIDIAM
jgi:general secretion pathway protein F